MNDITLINMSIAKRFGEKVLFEHNSAGIFLLIAVLEKAGLKVDFHEYFLSHKYSFSEEISNFLALIDNSSPLVGIGCHATHLPFVVLAVKELKKVFPQKRVILGGIGPSSIARELLENFSFIDAIVMGEGEEAIVELVERRTGSLRGIKGLVYREDGNIFISDYREPIRNLDSLPLPAYHKMDFKQYKTPTVISSRGCPYECAFCSLSPFWVAGVRYRSINSVMEELKTLVYNYKIKYIFFGDPIFNMDRSRAIELCRRIREENLGLNWRCLVRVNLMDEELMDEMSRSGCEAVFYGIESGSDNVLKMIKQGFTVGEALEVVRKSTKYFKTVEPSLMWGFPFETLDDFKKTLKIRDYLEGELDCNVQLRWLEPYPATPLYKEYRDKLFIPEGLSSLYQPEIIEQRILKGEAFYGDDFYGDNGDIRKVCIPTDITSIWTVVAVSHIANICKQIIQEHPYLFCDYYRYKTPNLEEKLRLVKEYCLY